MSADPLTVLDKVFELAAEIGSLMAGALSEWDLTPARAGALLVLHRSGTPMVQRELSRALRCTPRHVTTLVDALEGRDLVRRRAHPDDRRATLVELTPAGAALSERLARERHSVAHAVLTELPQRDLEGFVIVSDHVLRHLAGTTTDVRTGSGVPAGVPGSRR